MLLIIFIFNNIFISTTLISFSLPQYSLFIKLITPRIQCQVSWFSRAFGEKLRPAKARLSVPATWMRTILEVDLLAPVNYQLTSWQQLHERPWARATQLSCSQIPDPQKTHKIINAYCCFKPFKFAVICYGAIRQEMYTAGGLLSSRN